MWQDLDCIIILRQDVLYVVGTVSAGVDIQQDDSHTRGILSLMSLVHRVLAQLNDLIRIPEALRAKINLPVLLNHNIQCRTMPRPITPIVQVRDEVPFVIG